MVRVSNLGKCYETYEKPYHRLLQFVAGKRRQYYRSHWALRNVSLAFPRGACVGVVGRNGAGKTTLLQMIAGVLPPTEGKVELSGRVTALLELGSGFHREFTGRENVYMAGALLGLSNEEIREKFDSIAAFAGIGEFMGQPVRNYSKGMYARLSFAVYANLDPDIFIIDEALAVGDAAFRHRCMHRFEQLKETGTTIFYVSHDAHSMKRHCDEVAWIDGGKLIEFGKPGPVVDAYLRDLFHGSLAAMSPKNARTVQIAEAEAKAAEPNETPRDVDAATGSMKNSTGSPQTPGPNTTDATILPPATVTHKITRRSGPDAWRLSPDEASTPPDVDDLRFDLPTADARFGDERAEITGVCLRSSDGSYGGPLWSGDVVTLAVRITIHDLVPGSDRLQTGWILSSPNGEPICATNSRTEEIELPDVTNGDAITAIWQIELPRLKAGSYAWSVGVSISRYDEASGRGDPVVCDRHANLLVTEVLAPIAVHGKIGVRCRMDPIVQKPNTVAAGDKP